MAKRQPLFIDLPDPAGAITPLNGYSCDQARIALFTIQGEVRLSRSDFSKDCSAIRAAWKSFETPTHKWGGKLLTPCKKNGPLTLHDMWALYCMRVALHYYLRVEEKSSPRSRWIQLVAESEKEAMSIVTDGHGSRADFNRRVTRFLSQKQEKTAEIPQQTVNISPLGVA